MSIIIIKFKYNSLRATGDTRLVNMVKKLPLVGRGETKDRNSSYLFTKGMSERSIQWEESEESTNSQNKFKMSGCRASAWIFDSFVDRRIVG